MSSNLPISRRGLLTGFAASGLIMTSRTSLAAETLPKMVVTKDPNCGCCTGWVKHVQAAGFNVEIIESPEVNRLKTRLGVPESLASCHTAEIGGYVIEGHVPPAAIKRLLAEKPDGKGLSVPGMPVGSPGMEVEGMEPDTYEVILFGPSGQRTYARYTGNREA
ncbi:DUF411 domain-containing protein [Microvirga sp. BSC39]|uniref:DUF411 domain-containing protein n=1 Tax=Microvirga sp. BSC39 TaxID=1549810 RepID=UPI0004E90447|nr:DUF411 domain-containing protein [Microvirga sp. BSC39]KFG69727.1 metal-binding protein [Microvirga sp. BSC39]